MAETVLVDDDQRLAERLVKFLDNNGFPLKAAFWLYKSEDERWRFVVVPKEKREDPWSFYLDFAERFNLSGRSGDMLGLDRVEIVQSDSPLIKVLVKTVGNRRGSHLRVSNMNVDGIFLEDALIYRLSA